MTALPPLSAGASQVSAAEVAVTVAVGGAGAGGAVGVRLTDPVPSYGPAPLELMALTAAE